MKTLLLAVTLLVGFTQATHAGTVEQQVINSLRAQGYHVLEQNYTFLGRLRILAENGNLQREIVVNPGTGEILRDTAVSLQHHDAAKTTLPDLTIDTLLPEVVSPVVPQLSEPDVMADDSVAVVPPTDVDQVADPYFKEDAGSVLSPDDSTGSDFEVGEPGPTQTDPSLDLTAP